MKIITGSEEFDTLSEVLKNKAESNGCSRNVENSPKKRGQPGGPSKVILLVGLVLIPWSVEYLQTLSQS